MFASIRRYELRGGAMDDLARRVDGDFAEQLGKRPGFVSYEFIDCGDGEVMTISVFRDADQADGSRELAQRWSAQELRDFDFTAGEALRGEILVSRAARDILDDCHAGAERKFASIRRYRVGGPIREVMHVVDETFADRLAELDGFVAYHSLDCGGGDVVSITLLRDRSVAERSDEMALDFVRDELGDVDLERTEVVGGEVVVSRAVAEVLEPAHA